GNLLLDRFRKSPRADKVALEFNPPLCQDPAGLHQNAKPFLLYEPADRQDQWLAWLAQPRRKAVEGNAVVNYGHVLGDGNVSRDDVGGIPAVGHDESSGLDSLLDVWRSHRFVEKQVLGVSRDAVRDARNAVHEHRHLPGQIDEVRVEFLHPLTVGDDI